jgi:hypothetical protein
MSQKINIKLKGTRTLQQEAVSFRELFNRLSSLFSRREQANVEYMKNSQAVFDRMKAISDQKTSQRIKGSIAATKGKILDSKKKKFNEQLDAASSILKQFNDSIKQGKFEDLSKLERNFKTAKATLEAIGTGSAVKSEFDTMIKPVMDQYTKIMGEMSTMLANSETVLKTRDPALVYKDRRKVITGIPYTFKLVAANDENVKQLFIEFSSRYLILPKIEKVSGGLEALKEQQQGELFSTFPEVVAEKEKELQKQIKKDFDRFVQPFVKQLKNLYNFRTTVQKLYVPQKSSVDVLTKAQPELSGVYEFVLFVLEYKPLMLKANAGIQFKPEFEELYKVATIAMDNFYKKYIVMPPPRKRGDKVDQQTQQQQTSGSVTQEFINNLINFLKENDNYKNYIGKSIEDLKSEPVFSSLDYNHLFVTHRYIEKLSKDQA